MSESPLDEEEMAQAIAKAVKDAGVDTKLLNISFAGESGLYKSLDMPVLSDRELASAIYWEAEQYIPVPLSNITLVWNVLKRPATPHRAIRCRY